MKGKLFSDKGNMLNEDQANPSGSKEQKIKAVKSFFKRFWWAVIIVIILVLFLLKELGGRGPDKHNEPDTKSNVTPTLVQDEVKPDTRQGVDNPDGTTKVESTTSKIGISQVSINSDEGWPSKDAKYITAVPLDLTQIKSITKYRSCAGHDYSGYSFEKTLETNRSMKHYIYPVTAFQGTIDKVKMFAPFDGKVTKIDAEKDQIGQPGKRPQTGNGIAFGTSVDENVIFEFGHIYFIKDFKVGDTVKSGELIGYAALGAKGDDFDISLEGRLWTDDKQPIYGSVFDHMTDSILAEFAKFVVTPNNMIATKEFRDAHPCNYASQQTSAGSDDSVQLVH